MLIGTEVEEKYMNSRVEEIIEKGERGGSRGAIEERKRKRERYSSGGNGNRDRRKKKNRVGKGKGEEEGEMYS